MSTWVGVPPSPEEIETYVAYERMIDRLLNSPQYGERWARHWLDVAGYTDETGFANDHGLLETPTDSRVNGAKVVRDLLA